MKKLFALTLALCLLLSGCVIQIDNQKTELVTGSETLDAFTRLEIKADVAEVYLSVGGDWHVQYNLPVTPEITLEDGTLRIRDLTKSTLLFNVSPSIVLTVPEGTELEAASIAVDVGDVKIQALPIAALTVDVDTGDVDLREFTAQTISVSTDVGNVDLEQVSAGQADIQTDTGEIEAKLSGGENDYTLELKTDVGDVEVADRNQGNQYAAGTGERRFTARTDVGDIEVEFIGMASPKA